MVIRRVAFEGFAVAIWAWFDEAADELAEVLRHLNQKAEVNCEHQHHHTSLHNAAYPDHSFYALDAVLHLQSQSHCCDIPAEHNSVESCLTSADSSYSDQLLTAFVV